MEALYKLVRQALATYAMKTGRGRSSYRRICQPGGLQYAKYLKRHGGYHRIGEDCYISPDANVTDPAYVDLGNNVRVSECSIFGHDGSINMINRAFGLKLDSVGKIEIRDNVYLGYGCIIQPGVTIGPNAIVCAGTVVNRDVAEGLIVAGIPAKPVGTLNVFVQILAARNKSYPWRDLIERRDGEFDPAIEETLRRMRVEYFYPHKSDDDDDRVVRPGELQEQRNTDLPT